MKKLYTKIILLSFLSFIGTGLGFGQIISQYVETNSGTTPKGVEIWNNTGTTLDFSTNSLVIEKGTNGAAPSADFTLSTGTLVAGAVIVIGTSDMEATATGNGAQFAEKSFTFNGDDALVVKYGGTTTDVFGDPGSDPGSAWTGGGVSTANSNISLLSTINTGTTTGFTDPSTRFEEIGGGQDLTGFGIAPTPAGPDNPSTFTASVISSTQIDLTYEDNADNDFIVIVFDTDNTFTTPSGTVGPVGSSFADGTVLAIVNGSDTFNHTGRVPNTTYYYKAWSVDSSDNYSLGIEINETTPICSGEPSTQASNISFSNTTGSSVDVSWTAGVGGSDYILVIREGNDVSFTPTDGTDYSADTASGDFSAATDQGSGNKIVYSGNGTTASITGLSPTTTYHFQVFYFCSLSNDYLTSSGTNNDGTQTETTTAGPTFPFLQDFDSVTDWNFTADPVTYNVSGDVWGIVPSIGSISNGNLGNFWGMQDLENSNGGNSGDHTLTFDTIDITNFSNVVISFDYYTNGFDSTDELQYEIFHNASGSLTGQGIIDLNKDTDEWIRVPTIIPDTATQAYIVLIGDQNGADDQAGFDNVEINGTILCTSEPTEQAADITFSNIDDSSAEVSWTAGVGSSSYIVVARQGDDVSFAPVDGTDYSNDTASGNFFNATDQGSGNKVVYSGIETSVTISGLDSNSTYYFQVFMFCLDDNFNYLTTSGTNNDGTQNFSTKMTIALQDFDNTPPSWSYDNDVDFFDNGWGTGFYGIRDLSSSAPLSNPNFDNNILGENDLDNSGDGTSGFATTTFKEIFVENFSNLTLSFDWEVIGYNANDDDAKYQIYLDGVGQGENFLLDGNGSTESDSGTISFSIPPNTTSISLEIAVRNNGFSGYSGFDNFKIIGNYDGDLVYNDGSWTPNAPSSLTGSDDALVQDGTYATSGDVGLNSISVLGDASVEISSSDVLTITSSMNSNGRFTFLSDAAGSAQLADATGITINGEVTAERYVPARRAYRLLTTSVNNTGSINANWQEDAVTTTVGNGNPNPGFGTHITGGAETSGFDQNGSGAPSMFTFDNTFPADQPGENQQDAWSPVSNTYTTNLSAGLPYLTFVRGDRSTNLTINNTPATETTLRATGEIHTGPLSFDLSQELGFYSLVGNPYQAVVDFTKVTTADLTDFIYVWDASIAGVNGRGGYVTVDVSGNTTPPNPFSSDASEFIPPGMSFFVQNLSSGTIAPSLTFEEDDKDTSETEVTIFNTYPNFYINSRLYISSDLQIGNTERDAIGLRFSENFTTVASDEDATKLGNPDENYAVINNGLRSIDKQALPNLGHEIDLSITNYTATNYSLTFVMDNKPEDLGVFLKDEYLNTETELTESFIYDFSVDSNIPESAAEERFSLVFGNTTLGANDNAFGSDFALYPNPTEGQFSIATPNIMGEVNVEITNLLGQQVLNQQLPVEGQEVKVNAKNLSTGIYLVKLSQDDQSFSSKFIIE